MSMSDMSEGRKVFVRTVLHYTCPEKKREGAMKFSLCWTTFSIYHVEFAWKLPMPAFSPEKYCGA